MNCNLIHTQAENCKVCNNYYKYLKSEHLKTILTDHEPMRTVECCSYSLDVYSVDYWEHLREQHNYGYHCKYCMERIVSAQSYLNHTTNRRHRVIKQLYEKNGVFSCCTSEIRNLKEFRLHILHMHSDEYEMREITIHPNILYPLVKARPSDRN